MSDGTKISSGASGAASDGAAASGATNPVSDAASRLQNFAAMSAVLTGFTASVISPGLDPIDLKQLYLSTADAQVGGELVDQLLAQFLSLAGQPKQQVADTLLATASADPPPTALLARSIVKMWYLGSWYPAAPPSTTAPPADGTVLSANAYTGGLAWSAAQAHPMGTAVHVRLLEQAPPSLAQFGVDTPDGGSNG